MNSLPKPLQILIGINVFLFLFVFLFPDMSKSFSELGPLYFPKNDKFHIWQLISSMFMHGSIGHIFFNMFALASFGTPLMIMWGTRRFLTFYFVAGIGAGYNLHSGKLLPIFQRLRPDASSGIRRRKYNASA